MFFNHVTNSKQSLFFSSVVRIYINVLWKVSSERGKKQIRVSEIDEKQNQLKNLAIRAIKLSE